MDITANMAYNTLTYVEGVVRCEDLEAMLFAATALMQLRGGVEVVDDQYADDADSYVSSEWNAEDEAYEAEMLREGRRSDEYDDPYESREWTQDDQDQMDWEDYLEYLDYKAQSYD